MPSRIEDHGPPGDLHTAALAGRDGSIRPAVPAVLRRAGVLRRAARRRAARVPAEGYDPAAGRLPGDTPPAFSHAGLVTAARHLSRTRAAHHHVQGEH